jgi:hypothetical protein
MQSTVMEEKELFRWICALDSTQSNPKIIQLKVQTSIAERDLMKLTITSWLEKNHTAARLFGSLASH